MGHTDTLLQVAGGTWRTLLAARPARDDAEAAALLSGIVGALSDAEERVVVLAGSGEGFFLADVAERATRGLLAETCERLALHRMPVIAAIDAPALDAGLELALACDLRFAAPGAPLGMPAVRAGRLPVGGGQRLIHEAGLGTATRLLLLGDHIRAGDDPASSLVEVHDAPLAQAELVAAELATRAPLALQAMKTAIRASAEMPPQSGFSVEADLASLLLPTADRAEGISAFLEHRPPRFDGR